MKGSVRRRGATWLIVYDVGDDPVTGKRRQKWKGGFRTKRDAEAALTDALGRLQGGTYVEPSRQSFADYLRGWLQTIESTIRPKTFASYRLHVERHVIPHLGATR